MDELSEEDKLKVARARKIERFLSQPFQVHKLTGERCLGAGIKFRNQIWIQILPVLLLSEIERHIRKNFIINYFMFFLF
jgi:F0F1-type ATP synthase beta subunit